MVTKQEVKDYYAQNRKDSNKGMCPGVVETAIEHLGVDEKGNIIHIASFIDEGDGSVYMTLDDIKDLIRAHIRQYVVDLIKISEI